LCPTLLSVQVSTQALRFSVANLSQVRVLTVYHQPPTIHHVVTRMSNASNAQHIARMIIVSNYHPTDPVVCTCMPMYAEKNQRRTSSKTQGPSTLAPIGPVWQYAKPSSHPPMLVHICNVSLDVSLGHPLKHTEVGADAGAEAEVKAEAQKSHKREKKAKPKQKVSVHLPDKNACARGGAC
jgi:hypothetical protein